MTQQTPIYKIRIPDGSTKAVNLGAELLQMGLDLENRMLVATAQPATAAPVVVAASAAARDAHWGTPATEAARLVLQNRGAQTIRTDLGYTEQYYATYNATTNPGGSVTPGWGRTGGDTGWIKVGVTAGAPAFSPGWANYDDAAVPWGGLSYRVANGFVTITGAGKNASWGNLSPIFVLPDNIRPKVTIEGKGTNVRASGVVQASAAGTVATSIFAHFPI